ncbi:MAG: InlB B-repeat-containing protein, partial [Limisphaerales bacterium]
RAVLVAQCCLCLSARASSLLDTTFNTGSGTDALAETVIAQPDGKILLSGSFTHFNGTPHGYMVRLNSDGSIDPTFLAQPSYRVRTMALQPDGKIVIGGFFNAVGGESRNLIARLNADGSLDTSFDPGTGASGTLGVAIDGNPNPYIFATAVQNDGKILITGNFTNYNGTRITGLARLNSNGSLDTSFNVGDDLNTWGRSLTLLDDGRFIVTGWFNHYNHADHSRMAIVNPDGSADSSFAPNFGDQTAVYSAIPLPNGKYIVSGHSENIHQIFQQDIARLNADGSFDTSFLGSTDDKTEMVRLQSDGKILLCGYFGSVDGVQRTSVARLNPDGSVDDSFKVNVDNYAWSMFIQPDGKILVAGGFGTVDGYSRSGIVRLFPTIQPEDHVPPDLIVTTPAESLNKITGATLTMSGTASDSNGVASVSVSVNGQSVDVTGTTDWSATATLLPGTNVVVFSATDTFGNTASLTRYLFHPGKTPLVVTTDGNGMVTPNLNNSMLVAGSTYIVTAVPKPGFVFDSWSGSATSLNPTLTFMMDRGVTLHATFAPNPFIQPAGVYRGLVFDANSPSAATAGTVFITLMNNGTYTARVMWGGTTYPFNGRFNMALASTATLSRGKTKSVLRLNLQITDGQTIEGTVSDGNSTSSLTANKTPFDMRHPAMGYTGLYTVLIPGNSGAGAPSGYGFLTISAMNSGSVVISGTLADGLSTVQVTPLAANGRVPFYFATASETAFGWLTLAPNGSSDSDVQGTIHWEKSSRTNLLFSEDVSVIGSVYHMPHSGTPILALGNPTLEVDGGPLGQTLSDTFTLDARNRVSFITPNSNVFTLTFLTANGRFSGRFTDSSTRQPGFYQGVVLQKQNIGGGFFTSNRQNGRVFFGETGTTPP